MFCKNCGAQNEDGKAFCTSCGSPLQQAAPNMNAQQFNQPQPGYNPQQQFNQQQGIPNATYANPMNGIVQERNLVTCILLSIVTCGIYGLYWLYCLVEDTNKISDEPNPMSGGIVILLGLVTGSIFIWYWLYKAGEVIDKRNMQRGNPSSSNAIIYLVLGIFGLSIVSYCMLQNELNKVATGLL